MFYACVLLCIYDHVPSWQSEGGKRVCPFVCPSVLMFSNLSLFSVNFINAILLLLRLSSSLSVCHYFSMFLLSVYYYVCSSVLMLVCIFVNEFFYFFAWLSSYSSVLMFASVFLCLFPCLSVLSSRVLLSVSSSVTLCGLC